jgi:hypothetical protein
MVVKVFEKCKKMFLSELFFKKFQLPGKAADDLSEKFKDASRGVVPDALAEADDAGIAALPFSEALRELSEEFADDLAVVVMGRFRFAGFSRPGFFRGQRVVGDHEVGNGAPFGSEGVFLGQRDHPIGVAAQFFSFYNSRLNPSMFDEGFEHVGQHAAAVRRSASNFKCVFCVSHTVSVEPPFSAR